MIQTHRGAPVDARARAKPHIRALGSLQQCRARVRLPGVRLWCAQRCAAEVWWYAHSPDRGVVWLHDAALDEWSTQGEHDLCIWDAFCAYTIPTLQASFGGVAPRRAIARWVYAVGPEMAACEAAALPGAAQA